MKYLDGLINSWFKKTKDEKIVFYPYGIFGRGYVIAPATELKIKTFLKRYYIISFIVIIFSTLFKHQFFLLSLILFIGTPYLIKMRQLLSNAQKINEKISLKESMQNAATSMGTVMVFIIFFGSLVLFIGSIVYVFSEYDNYRGLMDIVGMVFFASCFLYSIFLVIYSLNRKK
jgi:hypothetical protein